MILAWNRVERYSSLGQYRAYADVFVVPERRVVFADNVLTKARPLFDAQNAADSSSRGTYSSSYNRSDGASRSIACGRTLFGTPDRSLCVRGEWQTHDDGGGNGKGVNLHGRFFLCDGPAA